MRENWAGTQDKGCSGCCASEETACLAGNERNTMKTSRAPHREGKAQLQRPGGTHPRGQDKSGTDHSLLFEGVS